MPCNDCDAEGDVHVATVMDISTDPATFREYEFCRACLVQKRLWCEKHGIMYLFHHEEYQGGSKGLTVLSACAACVSAEAATISDEKAREYLAHFPRTYAPSTLGCMLQFGTNYGKPEFSDAQKIIFGYLFLAVLHNRTLEGVLTDLVLEAYGDTNPVARQ